jgi:phenylpyruvate tautomerase PptA (4-oxalocrotonate tautomerase family)
MDREISSQQSTETAPTAITVSFEYITASTHGWIGHTVVDCQEVQLNIDAKLDL